MFTKSIPSRQKAFGSSCTGVHTTTCIQFHRVCSIRGFIIILQGTVIRDDVRYVPTESSMSPEQIFK